MAGKDLIEPLHILRQAGCVKLGSRLSSFTLDNDDDESKQAEIVLDYQQCEGGLPVFEVVCASGCSSVDITVIYSEGIEGVDHATGKDTRFEHNSCYANNE